MNIPKRFKLHEATGKADEHATDCIRAVGDQLIAVDQAGFAVVPIGPKGVTTTHGERFDCLIPAKAWAQAVQGKQGLGELYQTDVNTCNYDHKGDEISVRSGEDRPWVTWTAVSGTFPSIQPVIDQINQPPSLLNEKGQVVRAAVELCIDAEALVRISRAIGAEEGVRLKFYVNTSGRVDAERGVIEIRPVREPDGAFGGLMAVVIN